LQGAAAFEPVPGTPYFSGHDGGGQLIGWVAKSTDVASIKAYSGKPLVTLIGVNPKGEIAGAKLLHHSEPILLVGIPEKALHDFIAFYPGKPATSRVTVGKSSDSKALQVDIISGATVTALAQNQTILKTARQLGVDVGVVDIATARPGRFIVEAEPWSWQKMVDQGVFGRLSVSEEEMGVPNPEGNFIDLWYTIADPPQIGIPLLGEGTYAHLSKQLEPGQHLFVVLGNGSNSFKGSAFVRGGIFDRVRVRQGLRELVFRDTDYDNVPTLFAEDAPEFKEGAVFISRGAQVDPGQEFELLFLGSRYDQKGAYSREFHEFPSKHRLPSSIYHVEASDLDAPTYKQAWRNRRTDVVILGVFLLAVIGIFALRRWSTASLKRLQVMHISVMAFAFVVMGLYMGAQPSITQVLTLIDSLVGEWRFDLFATAPLIFISWVFIAVVSLIWGRGVFCGWVCPYGALTELINKAAVKLKIKQFEPPQRGPHKWLRYVILFGLIPIFLLAPIFAEQLAEVEPFKTTFLVAPWTRHWGFTLWWALLLVAAVFTWRPFCRFICPLGAALALFGSFRLSGPRRRVFCSKCTICTKTCEPQAIRADGTIDPRECLSCMECEANYRDVETCPPLVGIERLTQKGVTGEKLVQLKKDARTL
jgi:NosR/NirI family nitrous oxide reductase transcriptional regulator